MTESVYPPSHLNVEDPQPEFCDLCGLLVGGIHLMVTDVEGLRGQAVCDVTDSCRRFRSRISYKDRRRLTPIPHGNIGDGRVFPPGTSKDTIYP